MFRAFHVSVRLLMESHSVPDGHGMPLHLLCARDLSALQGHDGIAAMVLDGDCGILCFHRGALGKCRHDGHFHFHVVSHHAGGCHLLKEETVALQNVFSEERVHGCIAVDCAAIGKMDEGQVLAVLCAYAICLCYVPFTRYVCCSGVAGILFVGTAKQKGACHEGAQKCLFHIYFFILN